MISALKRSSFRASKRLGLTRRVADSPWRRERLLVLCYHGVSLADEHEWNPELYISPQTLERRLEILKRTGCTVLPLDEAIGRLYVGALPERAVTLTFDDAYYDFKARAFPLLCEYGWAATVYATTDRCERNLPIVHLLLSYLLWKRRDRVFDTRGIEGLNQVYALGSPAERAHVLSGMRSRMRRDLMSLEDEHVFAREVMGRLNVDYDSVVASRILSLITPGDLAAISQRNVAVEMHTHRHRAPEDPDEFAEEVRVNRTKLEAMTGRTPRHFCYPDGIYRDSYLVPLEREGIESATTCDPELASRASHRLLLPRLVDNEMASEVTFEAWVTGMASWLPRRTRRAHAIH